MIGNHSGTAADQQLQTFYVRAERPLTLPILCESLTKQ